MLTLDYYGFRDEEDGVLLRVQVEVEKGFLAQLRGGRMHLQVSS